MCGVYFTLTIYQYVCLCVPNIWLFNYHNIKEIKKPEFLEVLCLIT